jgi:hypothetical protein
VAQRRGRRARWAVGPSRTLGGRLGCGVARAADPVVDDAALDLHGERCIARVCSYASLGRVHAQSVDPAVDGAACAVQDEA